MSRSYKKHPRVKDPANKNAKRFANKKVRKTDNIPSGGGYKKIYCSWEISDYCWIWTKKQAIQDWEKEKGYSTRFETLEEWLDYWEKCTRRK